MFFSGLTLGDYLLWNWSLNANLDALALVAGLTLPPLAVASLWLLGLTAARLLATTARRSRSARVRRREAAGPRPARVSDVQDAPAPTAAPARKIAA